MILTWLGHGSWRIEIEKAVILVDPALDANPSFPEDRRDEAVAGTTHILITHGHGDHTSGVPALAKRLGVPVVGIADLVTFWSESEGLDGIGFNKGGTVDLNGAKVTMVAASHSSAMEGRGGQPIYAGHESGYMIAGEGHVVYFSGDTDIMADMDWMGDLHKPDIGILCAGGHYTMDMARAGYAAGRYFDFTTVIPSHYRSFAVLATDAAPLRAALPGVEVIEPEVLNPIEIAPRTGATA